MNKELKLLSKNDISMIVDKCFHAYASSHRMEAVVMAQELFDKIPEQVKPFDPTMDI